MRSGWGSDSRGVAGRVLELKATAPTEGATVNGEDLREAGQPGAEKMCADEPERAESEEEALRDGGLWSSYLSCGEKENRRQEGSQLQEVIKDWTEDIPASPYVHFLRSKISQRS